MPDAPLLQAGDSLWIAAPLGLREACLSMPAMRALLRMGVLPRVLCPQSQVTLWQTSGFAEVKGYPDKASARQIAALLEKPGISLAWEAGEAADAFAKAGIPRRLGPPAKGLEKRLTEKITVIEEPGPVRHRVQFYLKIVEKLGAQAMVAENFAPLLLDVPRDPGRILLVPDSDFGTHYQWPRERWEELAKLLLERGRSLRIAASGAMGAALSKAVPEADTVSLEPPALEELAAHGLCIAADGSVPHLAAHVGTRCLVLFGPGEPEWMRPLGRQHLIARRKVECSPCHAPKCVMDLRCQKELEVEEVLRVLEAGEA
ncbi:glycosyltransferase family 9 protein [Haloferula sp. BvORR071]|uniref:glycosyltransferase family 9 protein n=1 Tax=Haloferula sp. BvORR071 TaxID=1396141 RepID=UPI000550E8C0|nr:glycosyltransferase family 9 protein [Haloferula sp. BvORR071]